MVCSQIVMVKTCSCQRVLWPFISPNLYRAAKKKVKWKCSVFEKLTWVKKKKKTNMKEAPQLSSLICLQQSHLWLHSHPWTFQTWPRCLLCPPCCPPSCLLSSLRVWLPCCQLPLPPLQLQLLSQQHTWLIQPPKPQPPQRQDPRAPRNLQHLRKQH